MKRSLAKTAVGLVLAVLGLVASSNAVSASDFWGDAAGTTMSAPFKLHIYRDAFPSDLIITETNWRPAKKVDGGLVRQISDVRSALPNWTGIHHVVPGVSGSGK
jgi:hypothetical protein